MNRRIISLLFFVALLMGGCGKKNAIQPVIGYINGLPAITLYGNSNRPSDYILLNTSATREISYYGQLYNYYSGAGDNVYIDIAVTSVVAGILTTSGTKTTLTITTANIFFTSTQYTSN